MSTEARTATRPAGTGPDGDAGPGTGGNGADGNGPAAGAAADRTARPPRPGDAEDPANRATGAPTRLDELDARIIALVQERIAATSGPGRPRAGDRLRRAAGDRLAGTAGSPPAQAGSHGGLAREMAVLNRYRGELGPPGTQLAMVLRTLCGGRL